MHVALFKQFHSTHKFLNCTLCPFQFSNHLDGDERAGCFALFIYLAFRSCCVALPHDATMLFAVCDCGIS